MNKKLLLAFCIGLLALSIQAQQAHSIKPTRSKGQFLGQIGPVRALLDVSDREGIQAQNNQDFEKQNYFLKNDWVNTEALPTKGDPALQTIYAQNADNQTDQITTIVDVEGLREGVPPPDPTGDIGKDHYVMSVNRPGGSRIRIYDKAGTISGSFNSSSLWSQVGHGSVGDPIINYDHEAERWLMMEMEGNNGLLLAISETSDPTGNWKAYYFATEGFPDYPKFYVWGDSYFVTVNEILNNSNRCSGYALEKPAIVNGENDFGVYRFEFPRFGGIAYQPATGGDWEAGPPPPAGSPGYIFRVYDDAWANNGADHLEIWEMTINWQNQNQSLVEGPKVLFTDPFEMRVCNNTGLFDCIEQPGDAPRITALDQIIMYRASYRNYGTHESVVLNHVVDAENNGGDGGRAGLRWYELRKTATTDWEIYQQGTYAPPGDEERFMGMISQDAQGNIAMGYSVAGVNTYPGLRLVARRATDPLNSMTSAEHTIRDGEDSHFSQRWGDYCNMSVDPYDGRTFWFVGEYQPDDAFVGTRVYAFNVSKDTFDASPTKIVEPIAANMLTTAETVSVRIKNLGIESATGISATLRFEGQDVATENVPATIVSDDFIDFTFSSKVDMSEVGRYYDFQVITHWTSDQFDKNDTLNARIRHLPSNDVTFGGLADFPGFFCSREHTYGFVLRNRGQEPLTSARIRYRLNGIWDTLQWSGNLAFNQFDTVPVLLSPIKNGANFLTHIVELPNGSADEDIERDSTFNKFTGNIDGAWASLNINTTFGQLYWEVRTANGAFLFSGTATADSDVDICLDDDTCYELYLSGNPFGWEGSFVLTDLLGNRMIDRVEVYGTDEYTFCTPERLMEDVGAYQLLSPINKGNLSNAEPVRLEVRNFGLTAQTGLQVHYRMDNGVWVTEDLDGTLEPGEKQIHSFTTTEDLSTLGQSYQFEAYTTIAADMNTANDTIVPLVVHQAETEIAMLHAEAFQVCNDTNLAAFVLTLKNNGLFTITSFRLAHRINGGTVAEDDVVQTILPLQTVEVPVYLGGHQYGQNTVEFDITDVNFQGADFNTADNSASVDYAIDAAGFPLNIFFTLDDNPTETSWELKGPSGDLIGAGAMYMEENALFERSFCLDSGLCYQFRLYDAAANGFDGKIVLESPRTGFSWTIENVDIGTDSTFEICLGDLCAGFSQDIQVVNATDVGQSDGSVTILPMGGTPPYTIDITGTQQQPNAMGLVTDLAAGDYEITVTDALGCSTAQTVTVDVTIDATNPPLSRQITLSPNPTSAFVQVTLPAVQNEKSAMGELFHLNGQRIMRFPLMRWDDTLSALFSLENMPAGTYLVRVRTEDAAFVGKVVKE